MLVRYLLKLHAKPKTIVEGAPEYREIGMGVPNEAKQQGIHVD
jgi:hypothetical protein